MQKRYGFLLVELMGSLVALSFVLCLFGHFFASIVNWHRQAHDRLDALQVIQNQIEKYWQGRLQESIEKGDNRFAITYMHLPLPRIDDTLILPKLTYCLVQYHKPNRSIIMQLPGYI